MDDLVIVSRDYLDHLDGVRGHLREIGLPPRRARCKRDYLPFPIRVVHQYMVGDAVPGVMNADEEQQQRRSSDAKQSLAGVRESRERRKREYRVRGQRQHKMT